MNKRAFMSPEWLEMARRLFQSALDEHQAGAPSALTIEERFHNIPSGARCSQAITIHVHRGSVSVRLGAADAPADVEIDCDWEDAHLAASLSGDALEDFARWRIAKGRLTVRGDMGGVRAILSDAHDRIAAATLPFDGRHPYREGEER